MQYADIYISNVKPEKYVSREVIEAAKNELSRKSWKDVRIEGVSRSFIHGFYLLLNAEKLLPKIPMTMFPIPTDTGVFPINNPGRDSLVLVTGNSELTAELLFSFLGHTKTPLYLVLSNTSGDTVDMSAVNKSFSPESLKELLLGVDVEKKELIIPGFLKDFKEDIERTTGWSVVVGPTCILELPFFLGDRWIPG